MAAQEKNISIGVQIGGKGIKCMAIELDSKKFIPGTLCEGRVDKEATSRHIISLWAKQLRMVIEQIDVDKLAGIGFSIPGPFDYLNGIADFKGSKKYRSLEGLNITAELNQRIRHGDIPMRFINDAKGYALGLDWTHHNIEQKRNVSVIIGEGLGSAFVDNHGLVARGNNVPPNGDIFNLPFRDGIADDYFSGRGIMKELSKRGSLLFHNAQSAIRQVAKMPNYSGAFSEFGTNLARFLAPILKRFDANALNFGGYIGSEIQLFETDLKNELESQDVSVEISSPKLGDMAFLLGGARLFQKDYWSQIQPILPHLK